MQNELNVNAQRTTYKEHKNGKGVFTVLQETFDGPGSPFPYLEDLMNTAAKYPYSALGAMIAIASVVIAAVVTVSVAMFAGVFLMYGSMREIQANQRVLMDTVVEVKGQVSVVKTIAQSGLARQDFMIGMMTKEQQEAMNAYDRTHPRPLLPETSEKKE